jgi:hypothetical protein
VAMANVAQCAGRPSGCRSRIAAGDLRLDRSTLPATSTLPPGSSVALCPGGGPAHRARRRPRSWPVKIKFGGVARLTLGPRIMPREAAPPPGKPCRSSRRRGLLGAASSIIGAIRSMTADRRGLCLRSASTSNAIVVPRNEPAPPPGGRLALYARGAVTTSRTTPSIDDLDAPQPLLHRGVFDLLAAAASSPACTSSARRWSHFLHASAGPAAQNEVPPARGYATMRCTGRPSPKRPISRIASPRHRRSPGGAWDPAVTGKVTAARPARPKRCWAWGSGRSPCLWRPRSLRFLEHPFRLRQKVLPALPQRGPLSAGVEDLRPPATSHAATRGEPAGE